MTALLDVRELTKVFGGITANDRVSFAIAPGEIVGLIGPNGAGKSTLFNCVAGFHAATRGTVTFNGVDITHRPASEVSRLGIARTFQQTRMLASLTVLDNVLVGAFCTLDDRRAARHRALAMLEFANLRGFADENPAELPTSVQKRVDLARALATGPRLLMLDELMAGLGPSELDEAVKLVRRVRREMDVTLFLSEHVMDVVMQLSERVIVLDGGRKIAEDAPGVVVKDARVVQAYLGERFAQDRRH
jgi:branched-chain amino acid transport system ATP-binding protein